MRIGGSICLTAIVVLAACSPAQPAKNASSGYIVEISSPESLAPAAVEHYVCPDYGGLSPNVQRAIKRVAEKIQEETGSADPRSMLIAEADFSGAGVVRILVGGRCNEAIPELHAYSIYTVDLATNAVSIWSPN